MSRVNALHPVVLLAYFVSILAVAMFSADPWMTACVLMGGLLFSVMLEKRRFGKSALWYVALFAAVTLSNPLFSHRGATVLFLMNDTAITGEALLYGVYLGELLVATFCWFRCFNAVMSTDKLLFLFGKLSPKLSLLLSAALRFVPMLTQQAAKIREAQTAMGLYATNTWLDKLKGTARVYSALITWAMERAIDTGSSMKARGYGLRGRSHYALYRFRRSDAVLLFGILLLDAVVAVALATGQAAVTFYPMVVTAPMTVGYGSALVAVAVLSVLPFMLEVKEGLQWMYYRSKI